MERITDGQLIELIKRRNLKPEDPLFVSRPAQQFVFDRAILAARLQQAMVAGELNDEQLTDLLAGRLVRRDVPITVPDPIPTVSTRLIKVGIANLVGALIAAGVHEHAKWPDNGRRGMSAEAYIAHWPDSVTYPVGYAERYPHILLVAVNYETK
ncbi:TPA: hypothetical protein DEA21_03325, partial [Candidatus Uhrbacteria bacterium]|nr:hypothetical protein [Candidatus Uhrbacteria bacterium]HCU32188.1 hypothetical protein [Candidatus Uhrbacteria bacterium]